MYGKYIVKCLQPVISYKNAIFNKRYEVETFCDYKTPFQRVTYEPGRVTDLHILHMLSVSEQ